MRLLLPVLLAPTRGWSSPHTLALIFSSALGVLPLFFFFAGMQKLCARRISLVIFKLFCTRAISCPLGAPRCAVELFCFVEKNFNIVYHALNLRAGG